MKKELQRQGVGTSIIRSDFLEHILVLIIHADPWSANPAARLYGRLATRFGSQTVTASAAETLLTERGAFFKHEKLRVEIGPWAALDMLEGRKNHLALHEFRHLMFEQRRRRGVHSIFDLVFQTPKTADLDLHGDKSESDPLKAYSLRMAYEELYTYASDVDFLAKRLGTSDLDQPAPATDILNERLLMLERLAHSIQRGLDDILERFDEAYRQRRWDDRSLLVLSTARGEELTVPSGLLALVGKKNRKHALRRVLAEARDLSSDIRRRAAAARALPIEAEGKLRTVRELRRMVHRADRRTMVGPTEGQWRPWFRSPVQ